MANFEYVTWVPGTPLASEYLAKMSENDQHLKDLVDSMPKGVLGWAENTSNRVIVNNNVAQLLHGMEITLTIPENRLIRVSYHQKSMKNAGTVTTAVQLYMDDVKLTSAVGANKKEWNGGPWGLFYLHSPSEGEHTYEIKGYRFNGTGDARWRAEEDSPRQMIIEDLGAYVAPTVA